MATPTAQWSRTFLGQWKGVHMIRESVAVEADNSLPRPGMTSNSSTSKVAPIPYMRQLDGLRAIAVFVVLIEHFLPRYFSQNPLLPWGKMGVHLFFVLSGYLITGILLASRGDTGGGRLLFHARRFYLRRTLRIFPIYYLVVTAAALAGVDAVWKQLGWHLTYLSNVSFALQNGWEQPVEHLWTLCVEEQFYLFWPWVIFLIPQRHLLGAVSALIAIGPLYRGFCLLVGANEFATCYQLPSCLDSLGMGALLAIVSHGGRHGILKKWLHRVGLYVALPLFVLLQPARFFGWAPGLYGCIEYSLLALVFLVVVDKAAVGMTNSLGRVLERPGMVYIGKISYGIYLYHNFVPYGLGQVLKRMGTDLPEITGLRFVVWVGLTVAIAAASWTFIERPISRIKGRIAY
jgi:peptidoglycan/LPS O-acetylase OafA/YrhL